MPNTFISHFRKQLLNLLTNSIQIVLIASFNNLHIWIFSYKLTETFTHIQVQYVRVRYAVFVLLAVLVENTLVKRQLSY